MRTTVIANATAARFRHDSRLLARVRDVCRGHADFHATETLAELDALGRRVADGAPSLVVLCGGDGTFMAGITALRRAYRDRPLPKIALVPGGTVATVARSLGVTGPPDVFLRALVRAPGDAACEPHPTLLVRAAPIDGGDAEERLGFIFGTGLVASFFDLYYERGARGLAGAARIVSRVFAESFVGGPVARRVLEPLPCSVTVDGSPLRPRAFSLICASVIRDLGLSMRVTYRAGERPDRVHLVASPLEPRRLGPRVFRVMRGQTIGGPHHYDDLVARFEVSFEGTPRGSGPYVLDGDRLFARTVDVAPGPAIDVVRAPP